MLPTVFAITYHEDESFTCCLTATTFAGRPLKDPLVSEVRFQGTLTPDERFIEHVKTSLARAMWRTIEQSDLSIFADERI